MAFEVLSGLFEADASDYVSEVSNAADASDDFAGAAGDLGTGLETAVSPAGDLGGALDDAGGAAGDASGSFAEIDDSLDGIDSAADSAASSVGTMADDMEDATDSMEDLGDSADNAADSLFEVDAAGLAAGGAVAGVGTGAASAVEGTKDLRESLGRTSVSMDMTQDETNQLARDISNATFPMDDATATMDSLARQGVETADGMETAAAAADNVADATGTSAAAVAESMGPALSTFGDEVEDLVDHQDTLTYVSRNSTQSVEDFGQMINKNSEDIQELGLSMDETAAIMTALEDEGYEGREAIKKFREATNEAEGDQSKFYDTLGISNETLEEHRQGIEDAEGSTDEYASAANESITSLDRMRHEWEEMQLALGGALGPIDAVAPAMQTAGIAMMTMSTINMGAVVPSLTAVAAAAAPVVLPLLAIAAVVGVLAYAWKNNWLDIQGKTDKAISFIKTQLGALPGWLGEKKDQMMAVFGALKTGVPRRTGEMVDGTMARIRGLNPLPVLRGKKNQVFGQFDQLRDGAVARIRSGIDRVQDIFFKWHPLGILWTRRDEILGLFTETKEGATDRIQTAIDAIQDIFWNWTPYGVIWQRRQDIMDALPSFSDFYDRGVALIRGIAQGIRDTVGAARGAAEYVAGEIRGFFNRSDAEEGALSDTSAIGPAFVNTIADGIEANKGRLSKTAASAAGAANDAAKKTLGVSKSAFEAAMGEDQQNLRALRRGKLDPHGQLRPGDPSETITNAEFLAQGFENTSVKDILAEAPSPNSSRGAQADSSESAGVNVDWGNLDDDDLVSVGTIKKKVLSEVEERDTKRARPFDRRIS